MAISDVKTKAGAKFKATGASLRQNMTDEQKLKEGSKRDKVAFVCCLADPNRKQSRMCKSYSRKSFCVVGYKFELLEDTLVPNAPLKAFPIDSPILEHTLLISEPMVFNTFQNVLNILTAPSRPFDNTPILAVAEPPTNAFLMFSPTLLDASDN